MSIRTNSIDLKGQKAIIKSSVSELTTYEPDYAYLIAELNTLNNSQWRSLIGKFQLAVLSGAVTVTKAEGKALVYQQRQLLGTVARLVAEVR